MHAHTRIYTPRVIGGMVARQRTKFMKKQEYYPVNRS